MELVRRNRQHIDPQRFGIEAHVPSRLHGIGMEKRARSMRHLRNFGNGLQNACFIVRQHDAHETHIAIENGLDSSSAHDACLIGIDERNHKALGLPIIKRPEHCRMLDGRGNHAHSMGPAAEFSSRCQCLIVGFGTARSKNDLARRATEAFRNRCASIHHGMQRRTPRRVHAPRIAEVGTEIRKHSLKHAFVQCSCCGVIEIYHSYFSKPYIIKILGIIFISVSL